MSNRRVPWVAVPAAAALGAAAAWLLAPDREPTEQPPPPPQVFVPALYDAQPGEWLALRWGRDMIKWRVVAGTDFDVQVERIGYRDETPVGEPVTETWSRNSFGLPPDGVIRRIERDRVEAKGRWWDCWRIHVFSHLGEKAYWVTEELPVNGLLKIVRVEKGAPAEASAAKLEDYGFRDE